MFAAVVLGWAGLSNLMDGIAGIANSHVFVASAHFVFACTAMSCLSGGTG
jgi:hypothetical protein